MAKNNLLKFFFQLLIIGTGCFFLWNISFFKPFTFNYPPDSSFIPSGKNAIPDSVIAAPGMHYNQGAIGEFLFGKHYRTLWTLPVKVPVLRLESESRGLKVLRRGGGMQTISLTLADEKGVTYSLRSVDKDPVNVLPGFLRPTFITFFVRDQISATDPYATRFVAELAARASIPHTKTELVYVEPDNRHFNAFGVKSGGFFYLSPKVPEMKYLQKPKERFTGSFSSSEMLHALRLDSGNVAIDTALFLKCRIFDLLISDWDRHAGQWNWLSFSEQNRTVFRPLPKDRDQAMGYYQDGFLPFLLTRNFVVRKITSFTPEYEDIEGFTMNGRILDDRFLKRVPWKEFAKQAQNLQDQLTDEAFRTAVKKYPPEVDNETVEKLFNTLKIRRKNLMKATRQYYCIIRERNAG